MRVYEIKEKVFLLKDINVSDAQSEICKIIDQCLARDKKWLEFHEKNKFKNYCFNSLYPIENDKVYKSGNIYTVIIRTTDKKLADYINKNLSNEQSENMKCLVSEIRVLPKKIISKIYTITPAILKNNTGYWKEETSIEDFERRLKENAIKKYNAINNTRIDESFELYNSIEFKNKKPIAMKYKNIKLLGDKISLDIADDRLSQDIAYMLLGTGILEFNSRGGGFVNFRWL